MIRELLGWWWTIILLGLAAFFAGGCQSGQHILGITWGDEGTGVVYSGPAITPADMVEQAGEDGGAGDAAEPGEDLEGD